MSYDDHKKLCRRSWEKYIYLFIDRSKKEDQGRKGICNERKNTDTLCLPKTKPF